MSRQETPDIVAEAPAETTLTDYDWAHRVTYLRLLDADIAGADWHETARIVLGLDPAAEPDLAYRIWASHLARARWMRTSGYRQLLHAANANPERREIDG